jgi:hypothetical protein
LYSILSDFEISLETDSEEGGEEGEETKAAAVLGRIGLRLTFRPAGGQLQVNSSGLSRFFFAWTK